MRKAIYIVLTFVASCSCVYAQTIQFEGYEFDISNVKTSVVELYGEQVLKVERDLDKLPFDVNRLEATVDEPTFVKLKNTNFDNGIIEIKVLSRIQSPSPFVHARGFIGVAFRINATDSAFECIYLRPANGRLDNQKSRNHTVQYFAYSEYKFERLRKEFPEMYETSAPVGLNEWITLRLDVKGEKAQLFVNDAQYSTFVVDKMLGKTQNGSIGLWVDIGTEGYFKDLKVIPH